MEKLPISKELTQQYLNEALSPGENGETENSSDEAAQKQELADKVDALNNTISWALNFADNMKANTLKGMGGTPEECEAVKIPEDTKPQVVDMLKTVGVRNIPKDWLDNIPELALMTYGAFHLTEVGLIFKKVAARQEKKQESEPKKNTDNE